MAKHTIRQELYDNNADLGEMLHQLRVDKGYSQKKVADYLGVKNVTVSAYEKGRIRPTSDKMYKLSKLYGVSMDVISARAVEDMTSKNNSASIPEQQNITRQGNRMDEMLYYFRNLTGLQQKAIYSLVKKLSKT